MWDGGGLQADNPNKTWVAADENKYTDDHDHLLTKIVNTRQGTDILRRKETIRIYDDICIQSKRKFKITTVGGLLIFKRV